MNKDEFSGQWKNLQGKAKEKWGKLTDDELLKIEGKRDQFLGLLQKKYGYEKDRAEKELSEWEEEQSVFFKDKDKNKKNKF